MDVLNPSPALCLPQAMWLVYRVVAAKPDLGQDGILELVTPKSMRAGAPQQGAHARRALTALREFRLIHEDADGLYQAHETRDAFEFRRLLRRRLVVPPDNIGAGFEGAPDLRSALVWLMRQSPMVPLHYQVNVQTNMPVGLFTNDTRWNGFRWWSQAMGFGREALKTLVTDADSKAMIVPDPTVAVIDAIRHPFGDALPSGEQIPIEKLLDFLRLELPVLPGHPSATYPGFEDDGKRAIAALGLALSSAEQQQILTMGYQSDPSGVLALPDTQNFRKDRYVSNVTIKEW
ncbi:hypothetical protein [Gordonia rubripertincta]|uniref:Uncharacterized protein n=1 Tax=Gordonia rubripertincta TaxID=36822 RepID=A0ABT4N1E3_GORRU|nr:hypothetical protein [Gordonia rubripertincta]MCZ4552241.1 hypothetical protein [Gordonia rubripertincta]